MASTFQRPDGQLDLYMVEQILRRHESVNDAAVVLRDGVDAEAVAFVTIQKNIVENQIGDQRRSDNEYETQQIQLWETIFDKGAHSAMGQNLLPSAVARDFSGWVSAHDGAPLNHTDMNEWLDDTIETLLGCSGSHTLDVLELGTGSGLVLFGIAKSLQCYVGLELSPTAVDFVTATASSIPDLADKVRVHQGTAIDLHLLGPVSPTIVVINSVAQYFPSRDYLLEVIEGILRLSSVRTIFLGDIRSYALHQEFLVSKAFHKLGERASKNDIREAMMGMAQAEIELLVDPGFFTSLPDQFPDEIEHVEILPKKMRANNELSRYRYAAVIHVRDRKQMGEGRQQQGTHEIKDEEWIDFVESGLDRQTILRRLQTSAPGIMAVSNICYSKTILDRHAIDTLNAGPDDNTLDWVLSARRKSQDCANLSATDLVDIAQEASCKVEISWARQHSQRGGLDAVFHRHQLSSGGARVMFRFPTDHQGRAASTFSNQPLQQQAEQAIQQQLYEILETHLPSHLVPQDIFVLGKLPTNAEGEVDREALARRAEV
nr:nonribosomal peptide synthetase tes [Quercus suber]